jgi:3-oxoacyl-[acyl-carrier-protein] synthase II
MGIVSPVGCGVEAAWKNLLAGQSGARRVEEFEVSDISCQIANFVPRGATAEGKFNPDDWMEPKEQRLRPQIRPFEILA